MATTPFYQENLDKLSGPKKDAALALIGTMRAYGLGDGMANAIISYVQGGLTADTITLKLQQTDLYKFRFAANEVRRAQGKSVLTPAEYIGLERAYQQVLSQSGMPKGFYDTPWDFRKMIENDLAPTELQARVQEWQSVAMKDKPALDALRRLYGMSASQYAAYLLDPTKATPLLQRQARAVNFAAAGSRHGFTVDRGMAEKYGGGAYNVSAEDSEKGFAAIQEVNPGTERLANIYGEDYDLEDTAAEVFAGDAKAAEKRKKLASQERGTFSDSSRGSTGTSKGTSSY